MLETIPVGRKNDIVIQELDKELLIYDLAADKAFSLNEISALVWQHCDGYNTVNDIAEIVVSRLKTSFSKELVWLTLAELKKNNLIINEAEISIHFQGSTRRDVIRKIGFASLIALPTIVSITAPTAVLAQSGGCSATPYSLGCTCNNSSLCAGNCCNHPIGGTGVCSTAANPNGSTCVRGCQCSSGCCGGLGFGCINPGSKPLGSSCVFSCECNCVGNVCV